MTDRGEVTLHSPPSPMSASAYTPLLAGVSLGTARLVTPDGGGGGDPVDPKRFLNVGGTAVPIQ